jgi:transposase
MQEDPYSDHVFVFRGRRSDLIKVLWGTTDATRPRNAKRRQSRRFTIILEARAGIEPAYTALQAAA